MTDYTELVKALRCCTSSSPDDCDICAYQPFCQRNGTGRERIMIDATAAIEALQAMLPKRGEWKPFDLTYGRSVYSCSVCEQATEVPMCMEKPMYAYCPNCGAKMEVHDGQQDPV